MKIIKKFKIKYDDDRMNTSVYEYQILTAMTKSEKVNIGWLLGLSYHLNNNNKKSRDNEEKRQQYKKYNKILS